jgi:hypothetical protein
MDAEFVRVVDVIGIGHCVKGEVLTLELEVAKDKSNDEDNGLFRGSTFIPERVRGVLAPWGCSYNLFLSAPEIATEPAKSRCRFRHSDDFNQAHSLYHCPNITRLATLSINYCQYIESLGYPARKFSVQWL